MLIRIHNYVTIGYNRLMGTGNFRMTLWGLLKVIEPPLRWQFGTRDLG